MRRLLKNISPRGVRTLRILLTFVLILPVLYEVYRQWISVRSTLVHVVWEQAAIGLGILMLAQPLMGLISWLVLRGLKQSFPFIRISAIYFISQAAKYLPGGIWAFPGRVIAYQAVGVETLASYISLVQEVGVLFFGAVAVGATGLVVGLKVPSWMTTTILVGVGLSAIILVVAQLPLTFKIAAKLKLINSQVPELLESHGYKVNIKILSVAFLASLVYWLLVGLGFRFLAIAVVPSIESMTWLQAASIFSLAWIAGFVIVIAPSGLGVREGAIIALMSGIVSPAEALSVALVGRLWWMAGEFGFIGLSLLWMSSQLGKSKEKTGSF